MLMSLVWTRLKVLWNAVRIVPKQTRLFILFYFSCFSKLTIFFHQKLSIVQSPWQIAAISKVAWLAVNKLWKYCTTAKKVWFFYRHCTYIVKGVMLARFHEIIQKTNWLKLGTGDKVAISPTSRQRIFWAGMKISPSHLQGHEIF